MHKQITGSFGKGNLRQDRRQVMSFPYPQPHPYSLVLSMHSERKSQAEKKIFFGPLMSQNWSLNKLADRLGSKKAVTVVKEISNIKDKYPI